MTERPILFSSDRNVRALLAGTKVQTRRQLKVQPTVDPVDGMLSHPELAGKFAAHVFGYCFVKMASCPYGVVGDRLWVRETFRSWNENHCDEHEGDPDEDRGCDEHCNQTYVAYRATPRVGFRPVPDRARIRYLDESSPIEGDRRVNGPWKSPLFLPREWSRITLEVTEIRVQRLQDISDDDARAELGDQLGEMQDAIVNGERGRVAFFDPRTAFAYLWSAINGADSWKANSWVRAITFKRVEERHG